MVGLRCNAGMRTRLWNPQAAASMRAATCIHVVGVQVHKDVGVVAGVLQEIQGLRRRVQQVGFVPTG